MRVFRLLTVVFVLCGYARVAMPACNLAAPILPNNVSCAVGDTEITVNCDNAVQYDCGSYGAFYHCQGNCLTGYEKQQAQTYGGVKYCDCGASLTPGVTCPSTCPNLEWTIVNDTLQTRCVLPENGDSAYCEYKCMPGYYGTPKSTSSTCTPCTKTEDTEGSWKYVSVGIQKQTITYKWKQRNCVGDQPPSIDKYRCAAGYYSDSGRSEATTSADLQCTKCNLIDGIQSTSDAGSNSCTACCIKKDTTGSDVTGKFEITEDCCNESC